MASPSSSSSHNSHSGGKRGGGVEEWRGAVGRIQVEKGTRVGESRDERRGKDCVSGRDGRGKGREGVRLHEG